MSRMLWRGMKSGRVPGFMFLTAEMFPGARIVLITADMKITDVSFKM